MGDWEKRSTAKKKKCRVERFYVKIMYEARVVVVWSIGKSLNLSSPLIFILNENIA